MDHGGQLGTVYILHIEPPYKHARHYVGWVKARDEDAVSRRLRTHMQGRGARLLKVAIAAGCHIYIGQRFPGKTRAYERCLKDRLTGHPLEHYCVVCKSMRK